MPYTQAPIRFAVQRREEDEEPDTIGEVAVDAQGRIELVSADPAFRAALEDIVQAMNAQESLRIMAPPPPGDDPSGISFRSIARDDPELTSYVAKYLEQKYDLYLDPA